MQSAMVFLELVKLGDFVWKRSLERGLTRFCLLMNFDVSGFCGQKILLLCFDYRSQVTLRTTYYGGYVLLSGLSPDCLNLNLRISIPRSLKFWGFGPALFG